MISFVVIGRNVEKTIANSISSIFNFISKNEISSFEVIYVDSTSKDQSISIARNYPIKIIQLEGQVNAAVGRNEGANAAKGDILFFIDGDMELLPECYEHFFVSENQLVHPFLSGNIINQYYLENYQKITNICRPKIKGPLRDFQYRKMTGGLFLIESQHWDKIGGMDTRFCANEDIDFGLMMCSIGLKQRFYPNLIVAIHHTISYYHSKRFSEFIVSPKLLCSGLLLRKHLFDMRFFAFFIRSRYSLMFFWAAIISVGLSPVLCSMIIVAYLLTQGLRSYSVNKIESNYFFIIFYKILYDFYTIFGFFFYYPKPMKYSASLV